jgi:hypothetical protein
MDKLENGYGENPPGKIWWTADGNIQNRYSEI